MKTNLFADAIAPTVAPDTAPLQFIMHDPALCLCPGLFRHMTRADAAANLPLSLRIDYKHGEQLLMRVRSAELLSGFDLAILQAVAMVVAGARQTVKAGDAGDHAGLVEQMSKIDPQDDDARAELEAYGAPMVLHGVDAQDDLCHARCAIGHLLRAVGLPVNQRYVKQASDSLGRLACVTLLISPAATPHRFQAVHLLASCEVGTNRRTQGVSILLHPRLTNALMGQLNQDARISAHELHALGSDSAARVLHQRLCGIISEGVEREFLVSTLEEYIFPLDAAGQAQVALLGRAPKAAYDLRRRRLATVGESLETLVTKLGWQVRVEGNPADAKSKAYITRARRLRQTAKCGTRRFSAA